MPINLTDPRTMLALVERMATPKTYLRDTFFKNRPTSQTDIVDVEFRQGHRKLAPFVHEKIGGKVVENTGYQTKTFRPPLVAPDKITTAFDLAKKAAGENIYSAKTPQERAAEKLVRDLVELDEMITRREEAMCSQALFDGKIDVIGEGVNHVIEFGFTNRETLSGTNRWSDATSSNPYGDLKRWVRQVQIKGMVNPDVVVMSSDVVDTFIQHPKIKELLNIRNLFVGEVKAQAELPNGVSYVGTLSGLGLDIYEYNEWYLDDFTDPDNPITKPLVPEGTVTLLSTGAQYDLAYAAITLIGEDGQFTTYEAERVPDQWTAKRPDRQFLSLSSKPLPIPREVDSWFVAKVL